MIKIEIIEKKSTLFALSGGADGIYRVFVYRETKKC